MCRCPEATSSFKVRAHELEVIVTSPKALRQTPPGPFLTHSFIDELPMKYPSWATHSCNRQLLRMDIHEEEVVAALFLLWQFTATWKRAVWSRVQWHWREHWRGKYHRLFGGNSDAPSRAHFISNSKLHPPQPQLRSHSSINRLPLSIRLRIHDSVNPPLQVIAILVRFGGAGSCLGFLIFREEALCPRSSSSSAAVVVVTIITHIFRSARSTFRQSHK